MQNLKIFILVIFLFIFLNRFKIHVYKVKILLFIFYTIIIIFPFIVGIFLNNEFELLFNSLKIVYFFPLLLIIVFSMFELNELIRIIIKTAFISLILSFIINASTLLFFLELIPFNLNTFFYEQEDQIGFNQGYVHIINSSFSYWIFTIPLFFHSQLLNLNKKHYVLLFFLFLLSLISGRRILMLPFILFLVSSKKSRKILFFLVFISIFLFTNDFISQFLDFNVVLDRFYDAISSSGDSEIRSIQNKYFLNYIMNNPFFGFGMGGYMNDFLRSSEFRTAYESSYHYMVFERGVPFAIFTLLFYFFLLFGIYKNNDLNIYFRKAFVISIVSLLLASFSNPYWLSSFDYCIPFALAFRLFPNKYLL